MSISKVKTFIDNNAVNRGVKDANRKDDLLPLFHSTSGTNALSIISNGELKAKYCDVLKHDLVFYFYGKPAYINKSVRVINKSSRKLHPVLFVFNPQYVNIFKSFPFDTGAYDKGMYCKYIPQTIALDEFEIGNDFQDILKYLEVFYGTIDDYLEGNVKDIDDHDVVIQSLIALLESDDISDDFDERASTIEVSSKEKINLMDALECIILPKQLLKNNDVELFLKNWGGEYLTYNIRKKVPPILYYGELFGVAMSYLKRRNGL